MTKIALVSTLLLLLGVPLYAADVVGSWEANAEPDLAGYKIHYGTETGKYTVEIDVGNATTATIDSLLENTTYFFVVTAYDNAGNESAFSDEVSLFIPPPPDTEAPARPRNVTIVLAKSADESQ